MSSRLGPLFFLITLLSQCGSGHVSSRPPAVHAMTTPSVRVGPARHFSLSTNSVHVFAAGALRPGDIVSCRIDGQRIWLRVPTRDLGSSWSIGTAAATPKGKSGQFQLERNPNGSVTASCGRKTS